MNLASKIIVLMGLLCCTYGFAFFSALLYHRPLERRGYRLTMLVLGAVGVALNCWLYAKLAGLI